MPVNLDLYRGAVGAFNSRLHCKHFYNSISIRKLDVLPIASAFLFILECLQVSFNMFYHFTQEEYRNDEYIID